jgi:RNA 2',3'-cyclic 3'-phosphodiesterase
MMPDQVRAFVALRLSAEVEQAVAEFIESLRSAGGPRSAIRWIPRANLHLTLRFLGDRVEAAILDRLDRTLTQIAAVTRCFTIVARGTGAFPNLTRPRVVWVGLESDELIALAASVERAAIDAGLAPERRPYSPHLTIGRVRDLAGWSPTRPAIEAASDRKFGRTSARSMILYRSILAADSPTYSELARYPFGGADSNPFGGGP